MNQPTADRTNGFAMAVVIEGGLALVAAGLAWIFRVPLREQFASPGGPLVSALLRGLLATLPMLVLFWCLLNVGWLPLQKLRKQVEWLVREIFPTGSVPQFAMIALLAGAGEELLFRGVLQTKLSEWTTPIVGLVLSSVLFGLAHALSRVYFAFAVAVGAYLGWLTLYYHDLIAPIVAHALYDFLALVYLWRNASGRVPVCDDRGGQETGSTEPTEADEQSHR
jgi:membrane protease YdiL (CAAX protease family)